MTDLSQTLSPQHAGGSPMPRGSIDSPRTEDRTRVPLVIEQGHWHGYVFWLSYVGADLAGVEVVRESGARPLGRVTLQQVPLGALDRAARRCVADFLAEWDMATAVNSDQMAYLHAAYPDASDWLDAVADTNPAQEDDIRLARLCKRYLEIGSEPGWRETLAHEFSYQPSSVPTIIARARKRRFLTPVPRGQFGGQLTPKALRLLAPGKHQTAWELATEEQRTAAIERDRQEADVAGAETEAGTWPQDGPYAIRSWIARRVWGRRGVK